MSMRVLAAALAFGLAAVGAAFADDGDKAFENRDYATAMKLLGPLAEQGNVTVEDLARARGLVKACTQSRYKDCGTSP